MMLDNYLRLLIFQLYFHGLRLFELEKKFRDAALILLRQLKVRETICDLGKSQCISVAEQNLKPRFCDSQLFCKKEKKIHDTFSNKLTMTVLNTM